jgi:late competence protein required for DNA uptake (superfamily II DNA/RNA helicase)
MSEKGKTPSLITSMSGNPKIVVAKKKRTCKRCDQDIVNGAKCVEVPQPGTMGSKTYCCDCAQKMVEKSREDLDRFEELLKE